MISPKPAATRDLATRLSRALTGLIVEVRVGRDGAGRFKRERTCEYREPAQDHAFLR